MIIEVKKQLDIQSIGAETESIGASIDAASMPFLFEMLSGSLYSNPIGSICREITSNCFDSHIEANVDDPVTIKKGWDEEGYYISFVDIGVGLSPERIQSIYMNYFSSTKRETNSLIGGFGLGSKSPLSYTDYFYIITTFDNAKYQYIFSKGKTIPTLDLLDKSEVISRNGTEIRIYIKDNDVYKFKDELIKQLCYFDNVYFEEWGIENDYTIFEGKYFKYRNKNQYSTKMHIVLDKVVYPIDWKQLGISEYNIAVGVKFKIGELQVTPNREQLRYTDEIIELVKERIQNTIDELVDIFNKQNKAFDSFFEWYNKKDEKPFIKFTNNSIEDKLYLYGLDYVNKKNTYKYFEGIEDIKHISDLPSLFYSYIGEVERCKKKKSHYISLIYQLNKTNTNCYISDTAYTNNEKDWLIKNGYILYPRLDFKSSLRNIFISKEYNRGQLLYNYFNLGAGIKLYRFMKAFREEVESKCGVYRALTSEELTRYKEEKRENNASLQRKLDGKVYINSISENNDYDWKVDAIKNYTGIIIYGFREDDKKLRDSIQLIKRVRPNFFNKYSRNNPIIKIIKINKQNEKYFKNRHNMFHIDNLYGDNVIFRDIASSFKIEKFFNNIQNNISTKTYINYIKDICIDIGNDLETLYKFYITTSSNSSGTDYLVNSVKNEVLQIAEKYNLYNSRLEFVFNRVNNWYKDVEILRYTRINDDTLPYVLKFLYQKKKRLNIEYYQRVLNTDNTKQLEIDFSKKEENTQTKFQVITQNLIV